MVMLVMRRFVFNGLLLRDYLCLRGLLLFCFGIEMNKGREMRGELWMFLNLRILIDIFLLMSLLNMLRMIILGYCRKLKIELMSKF